MPRRTPSSPAARGCPARRCRLASGRIGFGGGNSGLVLDATSLAQLANTQALTLRSYSTMDFYTSLNLARAGLDKVVFDAAGFVGYGAGAIAVDRQDHRSSRTAAAVSAIPGMVERYRANCR